MKYKAEEFADTVLEKIKGRGSEPVIMAIDGRCASGKSTLAAALKEKTGCNVIHADDFFLRKEQRTQERFEEVGGNIDYERLRDEVLIPLSREGKCAYRRFDCKSMKLSEEEVAVAPNPLTVIEGSYSCHPMLFKYYDFLVFMNIVQCEQLKRIEKRNGSEAVEIFQNRWIPLEEKYFAAYRISERCDLIIDTSDGI